MTPGVETWAGPLEFTTGEMPLVRLFGVADSFPQKVTVSEIVGQDVFHYSIPNVQELNAADVEDGSSIRSDKIRIASECVLISKLNPRKAAVVLAAPHSDLETVASTEFVPVVAKSDGDNRFLYWAMRSSAVTAYLSSLVTSTTNSHQRVQPSDIFGMLVPWPSADVRSALADFLDREAAEIDAMDAELDRLVETLRERLDAEIEAHMAHLLEEPSTALQLLADVTVGIVIEPSRLYVPSGTGVPALRGLNVGDGRIKMGDMVEISEAGHTLHSKSCLQTGDLVTIRTGQIGVSAVVPPELDGANAIDLVISRSRGALDMTFLYWFFKWPRTRGLMDADKVGAVQSHFNVGAMKKLKVPVVPIDVQRRIAAELDEQAAKIDEMIADAQRLKALLAERRSTLITEVVTGKKEVPA